MSNIDRALRRHTEFHELVATELRGRATPEQQQRLTADPFGWANELQTIIDDIDGQVERRAAQTAELTDDQAAHAEFDDWAHRARSFQAMAIRRLAELQATAAWQAREAATEALDVLERVCRDVVTGAASADDLNVALERLDEARNDRQLSYV